MHRILRAGILGCGGIAHKHALAISALGDRIELTAFCDHHESRARLFSEQYTAGRAVAFTDHHEMLDRAAMDLLVICLPPFCHSDEIDLAAAKGIHLLVEKPIALTSEQAWHMVAAAESARIRTQVGFMYRFGAAVQELLSQVAPGTAGLFNARYFCNALHAPWWRARTKSGGQLLEQLIHLVDLMRVTMGEPVSVYSRQSNFFHGHVPDYTIEDVSATVYGFARGALGVLVATNGAVPDRWIKEWQIVTPKLVADFADWNHATFTYTGDPGRAPLAIASDRDVFRLQIEDLLDAIDSGRDTRAPLREGALSLDLALAAVRSAGLQAEIALPG